MAKGVVENKLKDFAKKGFNWFNKKK